jgi:hypothetical protein
MRGVSRLGVVVVTALVLLIGIAVFLRRVNSERHRTSSGASEAPNVAAAANAKAPTVRRTPVWRSDLNDEDGKPSEDQLYKADPASPEVDTAAQWARIDFDEIRRALPDSTYWKMAFPTKDPKLIAEREKIRAEWAAQAAKIQSNTATDEEIDAYYAEQQQLSNDYLEFLVYLADHYPNDVPRGEVGALKLAGEMHLARLEEMPRKIAEAKERHAKHEQERQAWLEQQKQFAAPTPAP